MVTRELKHRILGSSLTGPWGSEYHIAIFGMGCFWGAERLFWSQRGVHSTQVGYAGGHTENPNYYTVCAGNSGHNEVVRVVFDPQQISFYQLLVLFWENHDPTQGNRQGNDIGDNYRSMIMCTNDEQTRLAEETKRTYQEELYRIGKGRITTEIVGPAEFYLAEREHQQYLAVHPYGYCTMKGTGAKMPKL